MAVVPGGRPAATHVSVLEGFGRAALVECRLETGRTHQIRVHLAHAGYPILGDPVYGVPVPGMGRQALHAARLEFTHPRTGERLRFAAPPPDDFARLLRSLRRGGAPEDRGEPRVPRPSHPKGRARRPEREE
jgi:23S rRNA pseudouridine1911/1915/1917 synthase